LLIIPDGLRRRFNHAHRWSASGEPFPIFEQFGRWFGVEFGGPWLWCTDIGVAAF
jgi:hypothetical protein